MGKKSNAQVRRMEKRAAARGHVYTYVPPPPQPQKEKNDNETKKRDDVKMSKEDQLGEIAQRLEDELAKIDTNSDLPSKDRRSAKRKAEAVAAEDAGMSRVEFLEWCKLNEGNMKKYKNGGKDPQNDLNSPRVRAAEKLLSELDAIDQNVDLKSKDRRSAKRKALAIAAEESGLEGEQLIDWYNQKKKRHKQ
ncbi:hypothetical protein IV203_035522 [Nitzschia inconspicua]|uniref:Uncharacterized protein n=1 Tax=Nitzschia inconspicua TaxID=303405 RepID=A0A9K3LF72_9STRA|nr:hypothetical protein IV203_035522 [Nitzschia inconspicua]